MTRYLAILVLLSAGFPYAGTSWGDSKSAPASASCCCCPANTCQCGCAPSTASPNRKDGDQNDTPRFCGCDGTPWSLPPIHVSTPDPNNDFQVDVVASDNQDSPARILSYCGHFPHGPPQSLAPLSSIILLI
ncbi:MAG TPA: hypothetical protein PKN33_06195 [Phycisphaerae bacterium]|nr:hypothetical protein [Phycisphaerae bacterium]